jgi:lactate racemase
VFDGQNTIPKVKIWNENHMKIDLPYGKGSLTVNVPNANLIDVLVPREFISPQKPEIMLKEAVLHPFGTQRLSEMATDGDTVAVVVDDYTRPCPTQSLLPPVLEELHIAGVDDNDVTLIVACGTHQPPTFDQIKNIVGDKVSRNYRVTSNDITNGNYVSIGTSKRGNTIELLRDFVESDIKIILGDIEYHYFAGYGGTRKSILPGLASQPTIQRNHSMIFQKHACTGILKENPIHQEMAEVMHLVGCDFAFNVVQNSQHRIVGAWAGTPDLVMDAGVKLVDSMYKRDIIEQPDIIITAANGYPHDINLYQAMKAMHTACQVVKENGVVILVAECPQGHGSKLYEDWMTKYSTSTEIQKALKEHFVLGAHKAYYHRKTIEQHPVFFVSGMDTKIVENLFGFHPVKTPDEALKKAFEILGNKARVLVVPQGTTTFLGQKCDNI